MTPHGGFVELNILRYLGKVLNYNKLLLKSMDGIYLKTDLKGKINNLPHFKTEALLPVFEAVINSIHAIEDRKNFNQGKITVRVIREKDIQKPLGLEGEDISSESSEELRNIINFEIEDNGIGFNNENFESFNTAESTFKLERGGKGVGRFYWLKAFDKVDIESVYEENGNKKLRRIDFSKDKGIQNLFNDVIDSNREQLTIVKLVGFKEEYRSQPSAYKTTAKISQRILEHCLSYYIGEVAPTIIVDDGEEQFNLDSLFEEIRTNITTEDINISDEKFSISHIKLYSTYNKVHNIVFCADFRAVRSYPIESLLGTTAQFDDDDRKFYYEAYVSSSYLNNHVDSSRNAFNIPEKGNVQGFDGKRVLGMNTLVDAVVERSKIFLSQYLELLHQKKEERINDHISSNPTLRAVPTYCPEVIDEIELNSSEEKVNEILFKHKGNAEFKIRQETERLLKTQVSSVAEIQDKFKEITEKISDFNKDHLAGYILYRKMIIDLITKKIQLDGSGNYIDESVIHDILFPRKTTTDELNYEDHNLWLIDEHLTFHQYAVSDKELKSFSTSESRDRADMIIFSEKDEDNVSRTVSIIELKKPERKNFDQDPIAQIYSIIRHIRDQKVKTPNGRILLVNESTKFYCYAICDINDKIRTYAENANFTKLKNDLGYYSYNTQLAAHTEILAFDKLISDVKRRHKVFFEKLGIGF